MTDTNDDDFNGYYVQLYDGGVEMWRKTGGSTYFVRDFLLVEFVEMNGWWPWPGLRIPVVLVVEAP